MSEVLTDQIANGMLAASGVYDTENIRLACDVIKEAKSVGIETFRLVFPDQHGILRGKTITERALVSAFAQGLGVPSTLLLKDTAHRTVFDIWNGKSDVGSFASNGASDVLLAPDPTTFTVLPWSPHSAFFLCDLVQRSGEEITIAPRTVLRRATQALSAEGYSAIMGLEVEFNVFERIDPALAHTQATMPPAPIQTQNLTQGWQYLTETRYSEVEGILDTLRRYAEAMGLAPRSMEVEMGPSQFEFTFDPSDPINQADRMVLFRTMVKEVCQREGLHASFMAKPKVANAAANGWHIHQSLQNTAGQNVFTPSISSELTPIANNWIAGLLKNAAACCLLTTPTVNGYKRYAPFQLAPNRIQWGTDNRGAMIRALLGPDDSASRIENRAPDTTANPYFALAAQIFAGLDGIRSNADAPVPTNTPYNTDAEHLPTNLQMAIDAFKASPLFVDAVSPDFVEYIAHIKQAEWDRYLATVSDWEQAEYFNLF